jgi:hypothetical protein
VDHFQCYRIARVVGERSYKPTRGVGLQDNFGPLEVDIRGRLFDKVKPARFCAPVSQDGGQLGAESHPLFLVCYALHRHRGSARFLPMRSLFVNDGFGPQMIDALRPKELCVPSYLNP